MPVRRPPLDSKAFSYDAAGNIIKIGSDLYAYDTLNRLTEARQLTAGSVGQQFKYDPFGNLTGINPNKPRYEPAACKEFGPAKNETSITKRRRCG